jgi:hypothetical protein
VCAGRVPGCAMAIRARSKDRAEIALLFDAASLCIIRLDAPENVVARGDVLLPIA